MVVAATDPHAEPRLRERLASFVAWRQEYLSGDEKGEAQVFCDRLFRALGHEGVREAGGTLEMRVKRRDSRGTAFADLMWKPRCLIEMKKAGTDLSKHYRQAFDYWVEAVPDRPRYVVLCNFDELWVYDFDNQLDAPVDRLALTDLPRRSDVLAFMLPEAKRPVFGNDLVAVTREAATQVGLVFRSMNDRGVRRAASQRFALQCVVGMFAEDTGLLPGKYFSRALEDSHTGSDAYDLLFGLFREMNAAGVTAGGRFQGTPYFNGGLFAELDPVEPTPEELSMLRDAAEMNWSAVRPEIFGALFEGSMDQGQRHAQGAHFTSQADIAKVVGPTVVAPWRRRLEEAGSIPELQQLLLDLATFRVLDPACGSGNFLYVAYREMRRLEHDAIDLIAERRRSENLAAQGTLSHVSPDRFLGIDVNPFAVEVARVTLLLAKKLAADEFGLAEDVLPFDNLDRTIVCADALFTPWPAAHAIVGNPPYLGRRKMVKELGAAYTNRLAKAHPEVGGVSDFVCYWFPLAHRHLPAGGRAGFVATNSIRQGASRESSLDYVVDHGGAITDAWDSLEWSGDAGVWVSIVNWIKGSWDGPRTLWLDEGGRKLELPEIPGDLSDQLDLRQAKPLKVNQRPKVLHQGQTPGVTRGFTLDEQQAQALVRADPQSRSVLYPYLIGDEVLHAGRPGRWVIDFAAGDATEAKAVAPGAYDRLAQLVLPKRQAAALEEATKNELVLADDPNARVNWHNRGFLDRWWRHAYRRDDLLKAIEPLHRYIATARNPTDKRRPIFVFLESGIRPSDQIQAVSLDDDYSFGILQSSVHEVWFRRRCSTLGVGLRYTSKTVFDSFPWPQDPSASAVAAVAETAAELLAVRDASSTAGLSLASQYESLREPGRNRLRQASDSLDRAVLAAYGFASGVDLDRQILGLNAEVARSASPVGPGPGDFEGARVSDFAVPAPDLVI